MISISIKSRSIVQSICIPILSQEPGQLMTKTMEGLLARSAKMLEIKGKIEEKADKRLGSSCFSKKFKYPVSMSKLKAAKVSISL